MTGKSYLAAGLLILIVMVPPLMQWPRSHALAYAETADRLARARAGESAARELDGYAVASSNENERQEQEERREREEKQRENDDNDDDDDWSPPPPPPRVYVPPPPPPPDQVSGCLQNGGSLTINLPNGGVTVKSFQADLFVELARVDSASVPPPPGSIVGQIVFRLSAAPCGGQAYGTLPGAVNLGVGYRNGGVNGRDESAFALLFYDGGAWTTAPGLQTDPQHNYVSASVTDLGVYTLVSR